MKLRRNMIVYVDQHDNFYGRINKVIGDYVEVIDCGRYFQIVHKDRITIVDDYTGRFILRPSWSEGPYSIWVPMTSLRRLKQKASKYNKYVWKKNRVHGQTGFYSGGDLSYLDDPIVSGK